MITNFSDFILEELYFEYNFTPLYHITGSTYLIKIIKEDCLKIGNPARGPKASCLTRSKYYQHFGIPDIRLILNRELLKKDGYKSYPVDEWDLRKKMKNDEKRPWFNTDVKNKHFGKSQFPKLTLGKRPIAHNINGLPNNRSHGLEVEYEERILKDIKHVGKYIYALNFSNYSTYERIKDIIDNYRKIYPHIKILIGIYNFKEVDEL